MLSSRTSAPSTMPSLLLLLHLSSLLCLLSLLSLTSASPILVPDLRQCHDAHDTTVIPPIFTQPQNCCIPVLPASNFSFSSHTPQTHVRRHAQSISADKLAQYIRAYELMKALPADDPRSFEVQANVHCAFCNGAFNQTGASNVELQVHFSWLFLPWHRWYLYFHERILAKLVGDPTFSLVYWNYDDQQEGGNVLPAMFARNGTSLYDPLRDPNHQPPVLVNLLARFNGTGNAAQINANLNAMYQGLVTANYAELFMGGAARTGTDLSGSNVLTAPIGGSIENGIHNAIHFWTGNPQLPFIVDMGTFLNASRDPVFYAHHSNVDRLWEVWHTLPGGHRRDHTDPDFLNSEFYFYDENAQLVIVKVKDALDNKKLGVSYESSAATDAQWINYNPSAISNGSVVAEAIASGVPVIAASPKNGTIQLGGGLVALVARPTGAQPNNTAEVLRIQRVTLPPRSSFVALSVFVNLLNVTNTTATGSAEYVGQFNVVPSAKKIVTNVKLEIGDNLQRIGIDNETFVVISIIVKGLDTLTIQGLKISYDSMS